MDRKPLPYRFFGHLKTICIHKYWVFYYCCKLGIPFRGIIHDLSKFSPTEFIEGVKYYTKETSPINTAKKLTGYSEQWMHHKGRNKHHYEFWMDRFDDGGGNLMMPFRYAIEEICDYLGAGRAYYGRNFTFQIEYEWWLKRIQKPIAMHPALQDFNTVCLETMSRTSKFLTKQELKLIYLDAVQRHEKNVEPWPLSTSSK